ncbi:MAG: phosphatidate cytidylyltransferase, partial [Candidatus Omnitrophica bacterium]|nr:phosphatidate cytidylyltransferase [Candidatus Omnitrophota bacterium]
MDKLNQRVISGTLLIVLTILALLNYWLSAAVVIILTVLGLNEFFNMVEKKGIRIYKYFGTVAGIAIPLSIVFKFELTKNWELLFIIAALVILIMLQFARRQNFGAIVDISTTIFGILYVAWFFSFIIKIRTFPNGAGLLASL